MSRVEATFPATPIAGPKAPARGDQGRFSGLTHAFESAAARDVLKKYALLENGNAADMLAKLFGRTNFGYGNDPRPKGRSMSEQGDAARWSEPNTGGTELGDSYGMGPNPLSGPV